MADIVFEDKSDELILSDTWDEITFEDKGKIIVFDVIIIGDGFPYILPYILS
jgi:hypothetical protein